MSNLTLDKKKSEFKNYTPTPTQDKDNSMNFSKFYDKCWQSWNEFTRYYPASIHRRKYIINEIKKIKSWKSMADFGCGNALLICSIFKEFFTFGRNFYGTDISLEQTEANSEQFPEINFRQLDMARCMPRETFDIITCSEVLEHIPDYKSAIRNISYSLNPGGHVIITVPKAEIFYTEQTFGHLRHFCEEDLQEEFEKHGIKTLKCHSWGFPFHDLSKIVANISPKTSLRKFANGKLPFMSKMIFKFVNLLYYLNVFPMGKQIFYVGFKE